MQWADRRRRMIIGSAILVVLVFLAGTFFAVTYEAPSCADQKQNQDEEGVDCGGSCTYLCSAGIEQPRVSFVRAVLGANGRTDVIAYIENRNQEAEAKNAPYTLEVYGENNSVLARERGSIDLPARSSVALFVPGIYTGPGSISRTFLSFDVDARWERASERSMPTVQDASLSLEVTPRVTATLVNSTATPFKNVRVVATVFDASGTVLAASQTVVRTIPAQGRAEALFTWTEPFAGTAVRVEVLPVLTLP